MKNADAVHLVLAAGAGRRAGGPKALARWGDETGLARVLRLGREAGLARAIVVIGARAAEVQAAGATALAAPGVATVVHDGWEAGRTSSLQAGLAASPADAGAIVLHPVDHPAVAPATITALLERWRAPAEDAAIVLPQAPRADGSPGRGHPIVIDRRVFEEIAALGPDEPLRSVIHADRGRVAIVEVGDAGIHLDVNDAAARERALALLRSRGESLR